MLISDKIQLRQHLRAKLLDFPQEKRSQASQAIRDSIAALPQWRNARTIAAFIALPDEPDLLPLSWSPNKTLLLPRMQGSMLSLHEVKCSADLVLGRFNVLEPDPIQCPKADPPRPDIIFVPGVAFTPEGLRLGRGRGFYDRLLAELPPETLRIGICFRSQILHQIPVEPHDQMVHRVITSPD